MTRAQGPYGDRRPPDLPAGAPGRAPHRRPARSGAAADAVVNLYALIALSAALLGLFPVAIVFGLLAATRPGGRTMARSALALGLLEVAALGGFLVLNAGSFADSRPATAGSDLSTSTAPPALIVTTTTPMPPLPAPPATVPAIAPTTTAAPALTVNPLTTSDPTSIESTTTDATTTYSGPSRPSGAVNTPCRPWQNGVIGVAGDGNTLVCTDFGSGAGYKWSNAGPLADGVHAPGATCDPLVSGGLTGHTADGHAVACEGDAHTGTWQTGQ